MPSTRLTHLAYLFLPLLACGSLLTLGANPVQADTIPVQDRPSITVQGQGATSAIPDTAYVSIGVQTAGEQAGDAMRDNNRAMQALFDTLKRRGIADSDVRTTNFNISPIYDRNRPSPRGGEPQQPRITGYRVSNQVRVKVVELDNLGSILDEVVVNGANSVQGISFDVDNPEQAQREALKDAVRNAREKAELLAEASGARIGKTLQIQENAFSPRPMGVSMRAMAAESSVPIARGEQEISATVTVIYELITE